MKQRTMDNILLDENGVDQISGILQEWMTQAKADKRNILRCRLLMENLLETLCVRFERSLRVSVSMARRLGATSLAVRYEGEAFDPTKETEPDGWTAQLLSHIGLMPAWNYKGGVNELTLRVPRGRLRSEIWLVLALVSAIALGLSGPVFPEVVKNVLGGYVFQAISTLFMNLLGTFAGILVFLSVISGVCGVGNIADFSKMGKYLIGRNLRNSFFGAGLCALAMIPFFSFHMGESGGASPATTISNMILQMIPKDPVSPFMTGNMLQIVFMAVLIGVTIIMLGPKADGLKGTILQANLVILRLIELICKLLPLYILSSLVQLFWENGMGVFRSIWKPLVLSIALVLILMAAKVTITGIRCKVSPLKLFRKVLPGYLIGLTTASSTAAFGTVMEEDEKALGINPQLNNFGFPMEMFLNVATSSCGYISTVYCMAAFQGVEVNAMWFVTVWILCTIISCAAPPVSGGTLVCLTVLFAQFNIPAACLGMAATLILLEDFFLTSARIVIMQMELVLEARHWDILDYDILRS